MMEHLHSSQQVAAAGHGNCLVSLNKSSRSHGRFEKFDNQMLWSLEDSKEDVRRLRLLGKYRGVPLNASNYTHYEQEASVGDSRKEQVNDTCGGSILPKMLARGTRTAGP